VTEEKTLNVRFIVYKAVLKHWFSLASHHSTIVSYITAHHIYVRPKHKASYHTFEPLLQPQVGYYTFMDSGHKRKILILFLKFTIPKFCNIINIEKTQDFINKWEATSKQRRAHALQFSSARIFHMHSVRFYGGVNAFRV
jgi:hypothetical protein